MKTKKQTGLRPLTTAECRRLQNKPAAHEISIEIMEAAQLANEKWWPELHLKKGHVLQVITPEQCGPVMEIFRDGRGVSEMPSSSIPLFDSAGNAIGHISYNGRIWLDDADGQKEVPVKGIRTFAQREAEGWWDCQSLDIKAE